MRGIPHVLLFLAVVAGAGCKDKDVGLPCLVTPIFCETQEDCPAGFACNTANGTCIEVSEAGKQGSPETRFTTDAIECPSAVCLQMKGAELGTCSKVCGSNADCSESDHSTCKRTVGDEEETAGFVCVKPIAIPGGTLGCDKLCVCRFHAEENGLWAPDGGTAIEPLACVGAE